MTSDEDDAAARLPPAVRSRIEHMRRTVGSMSLQQRSRGHARALARFGAPKRSVSAWAITGLVVVASLAFALRGWFRPAQPAPLSYVFEGGLVAADGSMRGGQPGDRARNIDFSDGTQIELGAGARAHIKSLTEHGARVSLDEGELHARVVHWKGAHWLFDAGPFVVTVTGTAFTLSWTPNEERIDLRLENGSVEVGGPIFDQPIALQSRKWLTLRLREREILLRDIPANEAPTASASTASSAPDAPDAPAAIASEAPLTTAGPASAAPAAKRDWAAAVAAGKFEQVVEEAERWGLDACLAGASSSELGFLADSARYTKKSDLSKRALLAQRQRFAGSRRAMEAAFLLGRLAESQAGIASAISWFDTYLAEAPSGPYAPEALGRKMVLVEKMSGRAAAAKVAQEYLIRFPRGAYARAAGVLLQTP